MTGPDDDADELFAAALALHANTLDEFERAKTLLANGSRLRRSRRRAAARAPLREALRSSTGSAPLRCRRGRH